MERMKIIILTVALIFGLSAAWPTQDPKIVGGEETTIEDVPYQLQMEIKYLGLPFTFGCGANILGENIVLTAGHCVVGQTETRMRFRSGDKNKGNGTIHTVEKFLLHPDYIDYGGWADNDIALLQVTPAFVFSNTTKPIGLVEKAPTAGDNGTVSGWGSTSNNVGPPVEVVRKTVVPVVDHDECQADFDDIGITLTERMLCAGYKEGGKDSCSGDSGGALVVDEKVAGLISWGVGCAVAGYPGVYTNVIEFLPWIEETIEGFSK